MQDLPTNNQGRNGKPKARNQKISPEFENLWQNLRSAGRHSFKVI